MIIDVHTHYGITENFNMTIQLQLQCMDKHGIEYALISNIECCKNHENIEANKKMIEIVRKNSKRLGCLLWVAENITSEEKNQFKKLYTDNKDIVKGIKVHPDISKKRADDECFDFYYEMAAQYSIPVQIHTNTSGFSDIKYVVNAAKKHPKTVFVMAHMDISSDDCEEALQAVRDNGNIYGDTSWVKFDAVKKAAQMGIDHKMMFGTDNSIDNKDRYMDVYYVDYYTLEEPYMHGIMCDNAKKIFNIL